MTGARDSKNRFAMAFGVAIALHLAAYVWMPHPRVAFKAKAPEMLQLTVVELPPPPVEVPPVPQNKPEPPPVARQPVQAAPTALPPKAVEIKGADGPAHATGQTGANCAGQVGTQTGRGPGTARETG